MQSGINSEKDLVLTRKPMFYTSMSVASTLSPSTPTGQGSLASVVDMTTFRNYLKNLLHVLLNECEEDSKAELEQALSDKENLDIIKKFLCEFSVNVLFAKKLLEKEDNVNPFSFSLQVQYDSSKSISVALIKCGGIVEASKKLHTQIRSLVLNESNPYETLHSYISNAVSPYFKSYMKKLNNAPQNSNDKTAPIVEKKLIELEMGLNSLQENSEIQEVDLQIHPIVASIAKTCRESNRKPKVEDYDEKTQDSHFLNQLQSGVNKWVRDIQNLTKLNRDLSTGTVLQEINFWTNLERALLQVQEKRDGVEVNLTLDILKQGKRFHATVSFDSDTGLKQAIETVKDYNTLMRDFPLNEMITAYDLNKIASSLVPIFNHMKKIRTSKYPIQRFVKLTEILSRDLSNQLIKILVLKKMMSASFEEFERTTNEITIVFDTWDDEYERLIIQVKDMVKKKRDDTLKINWQLNLAHKQLQTRLENLKKFRRQHEQLRYILFKLMNLAVKKDSSKKEAGNHAISPGHQGNLADSNALNEVNSAYDALKEVDVLDLSREGTEHWEQSLRIYDERIERVEARITIQLRDQLGTAKNANEMFRIFSQYNTLLVRPHIQGAIREYQSQLIQKVKVDIDSLHSKFKVQYIHNKACKMSKTKDLPFVSGSIIWIKQIERQLLMYLKRIEYVLGKGWETHIDGQKLKSDGDNFKHQLNTQVIFDDWVNKVQQKNIVINGRIYQIEVLRTKAQTLKLKVNFSPDVITLAKEVRNLKHLGFRIPLPIVNKAHQANQLYPFAISLIECVCAYEKICSRYREKGENQLLIASLKKEIQSHIVEGVPLTWDTYRLEQYVQKMTQLSYHLSEKTDELSLIEQQLITHLTELETCLYDSCTIANILDRIQSCVDELALKMYSNLPKWVAWLDQEVEKKLVQRLQFGIMAWKEAVMRNPIEPSENINYDTALYNPKINPFVHEIIMKNQVLFLTPSLEEARCSLYESLHQFQFVLIKQKRIKYSKGFINQEDQLENSEYLESFRNLISKLPEGGKVLQEAYSTIDHILSNVQTYVQTWLNFQTLWDLQSEILYNRLGQNLKAWTSCLNEIKESRKTFDTQEIRWSCGMVVVNYGKVQSKVNIKYDAWHKDALSKFAALLGTQMKDFHKHVSKSRTDIETKSIDKLTTLEAVKVVMSVQTYKRNLKSWEDQKEAYNKGQVLLERQRYQFPSNWLYSDNVDSELSSFKEMLQRKNDAIQSQIETIQAKILDEEKTLDKKAFDLFNEWEREKPLKGTIKPKLALDKLNSFETTMGKLRDDRQQIAQAKESLELQEPGRFNKHDERLRIALEELEELRRVWNEIKNFMEQIDELREKQWLSIQAKKVRSSLDALALKLKELPGRLRRYEAYDYVKTLINNCIKNNSLVGELKSETLKERHWKQLMKSMNVSWNLNDLSLGQVWDTDLSKYESTIREMLIAAQGEKALEEYLRQVSDLWKSYNLELVNFQNKCKIIKGWDDLFNKVKEHIQSLAAMRMSPYYEEFKEEAGSWEDKLNRINAIFDIWIDVQRRWVYLDGIFGSSADIKHLLPNEAQKFQTVSTEFLNLMKKVTKTPLVIEVLAIQGVQKTLERLAELLNKIQKALGEYLEKQRASFPRFYFVGDEDLLEIIGNSQNVPRLQKHFKKMFAGVNAIILNEENTTVLGLESKEGEQVIFKTPVSIVQNPRINDWLTLIEKEMKVSLAKLLGESVIQSNNLFNENHGENFAAKFIDWIDKFQTQLVVLTAQVVWCQRVDAALAEIEASKGSSMAPLEEALKKVESILFVLADSVLKDQPPLRRKKLEHLIIEHVHQRDVTRQLIADKVKTADSFDWLAQLRFYYNPNVAEITQQLQIRIANAKFSYGYEYLGVQDKLVQTPLTDRCFLTMTQALDAKLGGSPFGPAGTGKTESVKCLGNQLGKFVLTFNCDETFDFQAMGRIFVGLCQVGAWGCFDEFNRLEERMLSAVSQQIQTIQEALKSMKTSGNPADLKVELVGKELSVNPEMAIFITMNPGYAGRSNLPDNLKKLFRSLAMTQPNKVLIAQVMLYSQGFRSAELLANKVVPLFQLCSEQLSNQSHYDFGLRSLKSVLVMAGNVKREKIQKLKEELILKKEPVDETRISEMLPEKEILIQSIMESFVPRLVASDLPLLSSLLNDVFPGASYMRGDMNLLKAHIKKVCDEQNLVYDDDTSRPGGLWLEKVLQLYQITNLNHGLMMVGPSGSGKSCAWKVLLKALNRLEGVEGAAYVIDPKAVTKDELYGFMDPNTREWKDGLFTHFLRRIIDNVRGELTRRQWIIFDGDVDPEWVENLNSVLDDNKLLTLPNGERLGLPPNLRVLFEVQDLKHATLATVSRCGMIWFSEDVVTEPMLFRMYLDKLRTVSLDEESSKANKFAAFAQQPESAETASEHSNSLRIQKNAAKILEPYFADDGLVSRALDFAAQQEHVMDFLRPRCLNSLFSLINQTVRNMLTYHQTHIDAGLSQEQTEKYLIKSLIISLIWSFSGDGKLKVRRDLGDFIREIVEIDMPRDKKAPLIDYEVVITGEWNDWYNRVPVIDVEADKIAGSDVVIPTIDTIRHEALLYSWLAEHKPLLLCGPPGSGKTMTLFSALRALPDMEVVGLNFSSATTPELMLKTFDHYCEYRKTHDGIVLAPSSPNKWIVMFCDEINLPDEDKYSTQRVITFIRQCIEYGGFYRTSDLTWVKLERIQFVGACNPPTDPGRKPLSLRFLRHVPLIYVDYPGETSLKQIYGTFNRAMLRRFSSLKSHADSLTDAMVEFFLKVQERFTADIQPHYIYSPREMSRWVRGINEAIKPLDDLSPEGLVRLWAYEALRLFHDRLIRDQEREWTETNIDDVARRSFSDVNFEEALKRPILYSKWLAQDAYQSVNEGELREFLRKKLKIFCEEELDVNLVLFDAVLDHMIRIDRVFRQPQGHLLLIGISGVGKTTLTRFVAWMNGLSVFQVKAHNKYTMADFDEDLRNVLRRSGCKGEQIAFIIDESKVFDASFLERINTLLANGEVPGLFEGDEYTSLINQCKEGAQRQGQIIDSAEDLYKWFTNQVMRNLHVVFTMNPSDDGLKNKTSTSPALFNRCVLNWFGDWSYEAYYEVGKEFSSKIQMEKPSFKAPLNIERTFENFSPEPTYREMIQNAFVFVHQNLQTLNKQLQKKNAKTVAVTPRHFLDFISQFSSIYHEKRSDLEEQQSHLVNGLKKIRETVEQVEELQKSLSFKRAELENKNNEANSKLKQMVIDQQEAEKKKLDSQELQKLLEEQTEQIAIKRSAVMNDLARVEPAVLEAQQAVKSIKKQNLVEIKNLANPPPAIKLALESICLLMNQETNDWKSIRGIIMKENFISTIINFKAEELSNEIRDKMNTKYVKNPEYSYEKINRASAACGPLVKWALAQLDYSDMLNKVEPLRNELKSLEDAAEANKLKGENLQTLISELEKKIAQYKMEYAELISEAQSIKTDLSTVEAKVQRSVSLLRSLSSEQSRWNQTNESLKNQLDTILGDCILNSAFISYAGYFDQATRKHLHSSWSRHLKQSNISFREDMNRIEYLSSADERLKWSTNSLPEDDLCIENAVMLKRFHRFPLIVDPSGQATEFILNEYKDKKIIKTSFLDDSFRKHLESALRFGTPLFVQDVECYDPILNPVLNKEFRKINGRVLISIGDQDIDFSPAFTIFLCTRDPTTEFTPDIASRVTFVNFTITRASLQSQCLNQVLKAERPDVEAKRADLLKLQGEFQQKLRHLEKGLLQTLNDAKGKILDDDSVLSNLERLKTEATEIAQKVQETDTVMAEINAVSQEYMPLANACSGIYFSMESLSQISFLYQYSLQFFLDMFSWALFENEELTAIKEPSARLKVITESLFKAAYCRVTRGMLNKDTPVFGLLLVQTLVKCGNSDINHCEKELDYLMNRDNESLITNQVVPIKNLSIKQTFEIRRLANKLELFAQLPDKLDSIQGADESEFRSWLKSPTPELIMPNVLAITSDGQSRKILNELLLINAMRPDRVLSTTRRLISSVLGQKTISESEKVQDYAKIIQKELKSTTPMLLCSVTGYDASNKIEDLAAELKISLSSFAIGSAEGFKSSEKAINSASKSGTWVLLKNVHLAPNWLIQLEKKIHALKSHPSFRLFLSMDITPKLPASLLRMGRCFVFEPSSGIKANLLRTISNISSGRMEKIPKWRSRLYFLVSWFHSIVQERLRYSPLGWSKKYEFNESDLKCALDTMDTWIELSCKQKSSAEPDCIPWNALQALMSSCIYGGRIDNEFDQKLLNAFLVKLFKADCFEENFTLVSDRYDVINLDLSKSAFSRSDYLDWVARISTDQKPSWLGLPNNAEKILLANMASEMLSNLLICQNTDEDMIENDDASNEKKLDDTKPLWMRQLEQTSRTWIKLIEQNNPVKLNRTAESIKDPLFRFFEREINTGIDLRTCVLGDLNDIVQVCESIKKPTNHHRLLMNELSKGLIPNTWRKYTLPKLLTISSWINDFSSRLRQLKRVSTSAQQNGLSALKSSKIWIGGLFTPEAYITAIRQNVAQLKNWSLEELTLNVKVYDESGIDLDDSSFGIIECKLQGARCAENKIFLNDDELYSDCKLIALSWINMNQAGSAGASNGRSVTLPVYLNSQRTELLFRITIESGDKLMNENSFYEKGVAFFSSTIGF